jgi:hypothetical protein
VSLFLPKRITWFVFPTLSTAPSKSSGQLRSAKGYGSIYQQQQNFFSTFTQYIGFPYDCVLADPNPVSSPTNGQHQCQNTECKYDMPIDITTLRSFSGVRCVSSVIVMEYFSIEHPQVGRRQSAIFSDRKIFRSMVHNSRSGIFLLC